MKKLINFLFILIMITIIISCKKNEVTSTPTPSPLEVTTFTNTTVSEELFSNSNSTFSFKLKNDNTYDKKYEVKITFIIKNLISSMEGKTIIGDIFSKNITVAANTSTDISLPFILKDNLSPSLNGKTLTVSIDILLEGKSLKTENVTIGTFTIPTLTINPTIPTTDNYIADSSKSAKYKNVVGNQILKTFVINSKEDGNVNIEFFGKKLDGSLAISEYWITSDTVNDFFMTNLISEADRKVAKEGQISLFVKKGINVLVVKTTPNLKGLILKGEQIGVKAYLTNNQTFTTSDYLASRDGEDNAYMLNLASYWTSGFVLYPSSSSFSFSEDWPFAGFAVYPVKKDQTYESRWPIILQSSLTLEFYKKYGDTIIFNPEGRTNFYQKGYDGIDAFNKIEGSYLYDNPTKNLTIYNNYQTGTTAYAFQLGYENTRIDLYFNVANRYDKDFSLGAIGPDLRKKGWRFKNDIEIKVYNTTQASISHKWITNVQNPNYVELSKY